MKVTLKHLRSFSRRECAVDGEYFEEDMAKIERSDRRPNHNTRKRMKEDAEEGILHPESILKGLKTHECSLRELRLPAARVSSFCALRTHRGLSTEDLAISPLKGEINNKSPNMVQQHIEKQTQHIGKIINEWSKQKSKCPSPGKLDCWHFRGTRFLMILCNFGIRNFDILHRHGSRVALRGGE